MASDKLLVLSEGSSGKGREVLSFFMFCQGRLWLFDIHDSPTLPVLLFRDAQDMQLEQIHQSIHSILSSLMQCCLEAARRGDCSVGEEAFTKGQHDNQDLKGGGGLISDNRRRRRELVSQLRSLVPTAWCHTLSDVLLDVGGLDPPKSYPYREASGLENSEELVKGEENVIQTKRKRVEDQKLIQAWSTGEV
jgi:hypothetical protein